MFIDALFDIDPAFGWQGGPQFDVRIVPLRNMHERRNLESPLVQHVYNLPYNNITDNAYLTKLKNVFLVARAQTHSFRVKDFSDNTATHEPLGVAPAGSTPVQLAKMSSFGSETFTRPIVKPAGTVQVFQNTGGGPVLKPGSIDVLTGIFTPSTAWTPGALITWSGSFFVPVRFNIGAMPMSIDNKSGDRYTMNGGVELIEVFGE